MAVEQKNFGNFLYVDDNAQTWIKRGEIDSVRNAVDGSAAATGTHPNWARSSRRHSPRKGIYQDPTTSRTKTVVFYTAAAFAAVTVGTSTLTFFFEGGATGQAYTLVQKVAERSEGNRTATHLAQHA